MEHLSIIDEGEILATDMDNQIDFSLLVDHVPADGNEILARTIKNRTVKDTSFRSIATRDFYNLNMSVEINKQKVGGVILAIVMTDDRIDL